jgi:acetate kinase
MNILVFNAGSASVKFAIFSLPGNDTSLIEGEFERFTQGQCTLRYRLGVAPNKVVERSEPVADIDAAIARIPALLKEWELTNVDAIGHRVVHGGAHYAAPVRINDTVVQHIEQCTPLAPLHNPANLRAIALSRSLWPRLPQVAVFDTAFHQTVPDYAATYAVPQAWRDKGVRRYGFHGISHQYIAERIAQEWPANNAALRLISCHLGNGASVCAIQNGVSVDTSMGMTPMEGLVMGTRCGDIDPGLTGYLARELGMKAQDIEQQLYHHSGMQALAGSHDLRDIEQQAAAGHQGAQLALQVFAYRVRKYIGAYAAALGGVDAIAFTGGIGENAAAMRQRICQDLGFLGVLVDAQTNATVPLSPIHVAPIHAAGSKVKILVIPAQEQWMIAKQVANLLQTEPGSSPPSPSVPALAASTSSPVHSVPAVRIPVAVSARHVHLSQAAVEALFGAGYLLHKEHDLRQPNSWAAKETVTLVGPKGSIASVRVLGPTRAQTQIEVSQTDAYTLGLDVPLRASGQLNDTPSVLLRGSHGDVTTCGIIVAARHIHMHPHDAAALGLQDGALVEVSLGSAERKVVFGHTLVRVSAQFATEMHIDTDEANAAGIRFQTQAELVRNGIHHGHITQP